VYPLKKVKTGLITISVLSLVLMVAASVVIYRKNQTYATYLSDIVSNRVSPLVSNISNVDSVLSDIVEKQTITKSQAQSLYGNINSIKSQTQTLLDIAIRLEKIPRNRIDKVINTNEKITLYFKSLYEALGEDESDPLTQTQLEGFIEFQSLASLYKKIVKSYVTGITDRGVSGEYWHEYFVDGVEDDYWINIVQGLEDVTPEYSDFTLLK
jgi:hypothetical protein